MTAPIKNYPPNAGQPLEGYEAFYQALMDASYHNAAEGAGEAGQAGKAERRAAAIAVEHGWYFWQIEQAHKAAAPLVAFGSLMQKIMDQLRKSA